MEPSIKLRNCVKRGACYIVDGDADVLQEHLVTVLRVDAVHKTLRWGLALGQQGWPLLYLPHRSHLLQGS